MWRFFSVMLLLLCLQGNAAGKAPASVYSPVFLDSILKHNTDSVRWNEVAMRLDIHQPPSKITLLQQQKSGQRSAVFLGMALAILLIVLFFRLLFDDFFYSAFEGIFSVKKFVIYFQSKKYDSFLALMVLFFTKIWILSLMVYVGIRYVLDGDFTSFDRRDFLGVWLLLFLFFTLKNLAEFIFNSVINTQQTFKAFFLQNLFAEFMLELVLLVILLIYLYNTQINTTLLKVFSLLFFTAYVVFNIIRSYQLMRNVRIPYKLHFFLYICAFKIVPVLLLAKYILNRVIAS